ncbi:MAG: TrkH family potassium uptake protein [candidate division WOR-3 bacterium]|nr:MAG: TrkH family potassium uptake protein [candidate division WOR-3 bacterium]
MRNRYTTLRVVFNLIGSLLVILSIFFLLPIAVAILSGELNESYLTVAAFVVPSSLCMVLGIVCRSLLRPGNPTSLQAMLICSLAWILFSAFGALPFVIALNVPILDGFFEAMSGFTTTGITMLSGLDAMPKSILFWRSLTQWIGGLGILTFFLAVTYRGGGAHALFGAESHKIGMERPVPGLANTLKILWLIYTSFTTVIIGLLVLAGMSLFDSVCHSFTALSTGGFSPHDASIAYYQISSYPYFRAIEYILVLGMLMGGMNFLVHHRVFRRDIKALFDTTEMRYWWSLIVIFFLIILVERYMHVLPVVQMSVNHGGFWQQLEAAIRTVIFQVVAIITTTGFSTEDIGSPFFGHVARQLFLVMMVIGGCVGSTGGGLKVFRITILTKLIKRELYRLRVPRRALSDIIIDGKLLDTSEVYRVGSLFFAWIVLLIIGGAVTALLSHYGPLESASGMFSALGNIGPCYIPVNGMASLNPVIKIVYILGMLAGRLEILPVLLLFSMRAWRS